MLARVVAASARARPMVRIAKCMMAFWWANACATGRKECGEHDDGTGGVAVLPVPAKLLPVLGHYRPIRRRLICRKDPREEDDQAQGDQQCGHESRTRSAGIAAAFSKEEAAVGEDAPGRPLRLIVVNLSAAVMVAHFHRVEE